MSRFATRLWIAFGVTVTSLTLFVVLFAAAYFFFDKFGPYAARPFIMITVAVGGPILGVTALKKSIQAVGAYSAVVACGSIVGAVGGFYFSRYGTRLLGLFAIPAILIFPFLGALVATFIRRRHTVEVTR
jgi:hypothetical protein